MFQQEHLRLEREGTTEAQTHAHAAVECGDGAAEVCLGEPHFSRQGDRGGTHLRRGRFDVERERQREVLQDGQRVEQHGPLRDDAEAVDDRQPIGAVA